MRLAFSFVWLGLTALAVAQDDPPQIAWQRTYQDAVELARRAQRPLLLCVNMDAESASEQTARLRYRDPAFVEATRAFVCAIASPIRHNPHDYDEHGRRIPCARFGEITCGEHLAMEPEIFARVGGERIAPRHTLYDVEGHQVFDLFLLFDLQEIDRRVKAAAAEIGSAWNEPVPEALDALCNDPRNTARSALERRFLAGDEATRLAILDVVSRTTAVAQLEPLRLALHGDNGAVAARASAIASTHGWAATLEPTLREAMTWAAKERLEDLGKRWAGLMPDDEASRRLALSFALDGPEALRQVLRERLLTSAAEEERDALKTLWSGHVAHLASALVDTPDYVLEPRAPWSNLPVQPALELLLERLDAILGVRPEDPVVLFEMGRTSLLLGERLIQEGGNPSFFLSDALRFLEDALPNLPAGDERRAAAMLMRARAAFLRNDLGECQLESHRALVEEGGERSIRTEAARLAFDAALRELSERFETLSLVDFARSFADQIRLAETLLPEGEVGETDWQRIANLYAFCGRTGDQARVLEAGVARFPESVPLHGSWRDLMWSAGYLARLLERYEALETRNAESATTAWFEGSVWVGRAEEQRRVLQFAAARVSYQGARDAFQRSADRNADYEATVRQWSTTIDVGDAICLMELRDLERAAESLARAFANGLSLDQVDGLEWQPQDLIEKLVEHGLEGHRLFEILAAQVPDRGDILERVLWATFREANRARGRSEPEVSDRFFRECLRVYDALDAAVDHAGNAEDRARALLENARILVQEDEPDEAFSLLQRAATALGRDWKQLATTVVTERWLEELGPSETYVRTGR